MAVMSLMLSGFSGVSFAHHVAGFLLRVCVQFIKSAKVLSGETRIGPEGSAGGNLFVLSKDLLRLFSFKKSPSSDGLYFFVRA